MSTDREKALDMALAQIDKQFGKGSIMRMGDKTTMGIESVSTGALSLDLALGIGGLPRGRVTEIYGPESSGKSTLAMHVVAEAQRNGGVCAYIDAEHAMDPIYARAIGVDVDQLLISQPDTGEQALEITDMLVRSGSIDVVVIDSVAALTPRAEIEGEMGDTHVGLQARLMSQALRKLTGNLSKTKTIAIFINQLREKIGVMFGCFDYDTRVTLADGTQEKIGKIVNQKLPVEVLSYDFERGELVAKPITNWFDNGVAERFLDFTVARPGRGRRSGFAATENHMISTPGGWRAAGELVVGDRVMQSATEYLSDFQWEVVLGGLMGDGALSPTRNGVERTIPVGPRSEAGGVRRLEGLVVRQRDGEPVDERQGCGLPRRATSRRARLAPRRGVRRRQEGVERRLPEASHPVVIGRVVHGRRGFHRFAPRGSSSAPRVAAGDRRSVSRRSPATARNGSAPIWPTRGASRRSSIVAGSGRWRSSSSRRPRRRSSTRSSLRSCIRRWSTSCSPSTGVASVSSRCSPSRGRC